MQAVIMAAGKSTRTYPLTVKRPKPLLKMLDRTLLEHNLDQLVGLVDEVVIIVGFMKEQIMEKMGDEYKGMKLVYVEQTEQLGTGHAILTAEEKIGDRFIIMPGDDMFFHDDLKKLVDHKYACLAKEVPNPEAFGIFVVEGGFINDIEEKPSEPKSNLANTACWIADRKLFDLLKAVEKSERGEIEATCALKALLAQENVGCEIAEGWLPVGYPWKYLEANVDLLRRINEHKIDESAKIEAGVTIKGDVTIGKGTIIKSGTYIEGPVFIGNNCTIGPQAYIRKDTIIMDNVNTRSELYDVVLMDGVTAKHASYIAHSVIGPGCNIAAGTITADYRHDAGENWTMVKGMKLNTGRRKLGAFLGDRVNTGIGTLIYPGRKIWPHCTTLPGEIVKKDIEKSDYMTTDKR